MAGNTKTIIRAFDGSLADAEGLLAVERATFDECPYSAEQVRAMLADGPQRAWLAVGGESVAGFTIAFPTSGLHGVQWEVDLLAVLPAWRGRGLATKLIQAAVADGVDVACQARAFVATDNTASARAFSRSGFRAGPGTCNLLIYRTEGLNPYPWPAPGVSVREAANIDEVAGWLPDLPAGQGQPGLTLLLAEQDGQPAGYAELIEVQTLLYRGVWIESLVAPGQTVRHALVHEAVQRAIGAGQDEIGAMVPAHNWPLQESLLARGFRSLGDFSGFIADLPLPGLAAPKHVTGRPRDYRV
jgi:GNAT superfamily N-acetyltransferase